LLEESPEGLTAPEIGAKLGVSTRTSHRDLLALRSAGYPLAASGARWRFIEGQPLTTALAADGASQGSERDRALILDRAIRQRHPATASLAVHEPAGLVQLSIAPLLLRYFEGSLFVVAREHPDGRLRTLAVERLAHVKLSSGRFPKAEPKGLEAYVRDFFRSEAALNLRRVTVRFEPGEAWRVTERTWHPSQRVAPEPDGAALVGFRVPGFAWVKAWVMGFGAAALVVDPPELVAEIRTELELTRERYRALGARLPQLDLFALQK
jgi:predicted DNA-binding transcriptional regulator YafY